jgi:hypothetical protein
MDDVIARRPQIVDGHMELVFDGASGFRQTGFKPERL